MSRYQKKQRIYVQFFVRKAIGKIVQITFDDECTQHLKHCESDRVDRRNTVHKSQQSRCISTTSSCSLYNTRGTRTNVNYHDQARSIAYINANRSIFDGTQDTSVLFQN